MSPRASRLLSYITLVLVVLWTVAAVLWLVSSLVVELRALHMLEVGQ